MSVWTGLERATKRSPVVLEGVARRLAAEGRNGDTELVHMSREELSTLSRFGKLTTNPRTGLKEAFSLGGFIGSVLPVVGAIGGGMLGGPWGAAAGSALGTEIGSGGRATPTQLITNAGLSYAGASMFPGAGGTGGGAGGASGVDAWDLSNPMVTDPNTGAYISGGGPLVPTGGAPVQDRSFNYTGQGLSQGPMSNLQQLPGAFMNFMSQGGFGGGGAGAMPWGSPGNLLTMGSGLYGLYNADQQRRLMQMYANQADPFASQRGYYGQQLQRLQSDPSGYLPTLPGYTAGLDAVQRSMAANGYLGSGNMMTALQQYGGNAFQAEAARLAGLAGAGANPAAPGEIALRGSMASNDLTGKSLGSLGYGAFMASPQSGTMNPAMLAYLSTLH